MRIVPTPTLAPAPAAAGPLRVLDVTIFYAPVSGGVRTYLDMKADDFRTRGVAHAMAVPGPERGRRRMGATTVHLLRGLPVPFTPGYRLMYSAAELERVIREERPDVIEVGSPFLVPLLLEKAMGALGGTRIPTVGFYHADLVRTYVEPYVRHFPARAREALRARARRFVRRVYSRFDVTVAASASVARELRLLGLDRVEHISLGVDLETFRPTRRSDALRRRLGVPDHVPIALFAGRLCPEKGLGVVVKAHGEMPPGARPHLLFVGEGPSTGRLERLARSRPDLTLLPVISERDELARIYASSDFYLAAGPGETFGLAVVEALASGLPLLGVDSGAVKDRVRASKAGELYGPGDPKSCAEAMSRLSRGPLDKLARRARSYAEEELGWDTTFRRLSSLYRRLARVGALP